MDSELRDLYQEVILDHNRRPHNFGRLDEGNCEADGHNPLCGDQVHVSVIMDENIISDVKFDGQGCAISKASASMMTDAVKGKTRAEAEELFHQFHAMVTGEKQLTDVEIEELGKLAVFSGVKEYPTRIKCASLAWHTLQAAMNHRQAAVTPE